MSEKSDAVIALTRSMIREIEDPVELQRQLREMLESEFPVKRSVFEAGEVMPMHEFLARYQSKVCVGIVPHFYQSEVEVIGVDAERGLLIKVFPPNGLNGAPAVERPAPGEVEG